MVEQSMLPIDGNVPADTTPTRSDPVDTGHIESMGTMHDTKARSIAEAAAQGGYAQEGEQSYPASGPRIMAGMRGAADMDKTPNRGLRVDTDADGE